MVKIVLIIIIVNCLIGIGLWWMIVRMIEVCMIRVRHELREYMLRRNDIKRCSRCDNDTDFIVYKGGTYLPGV